MTVRTLRSLLIGLAAVVLAACGADKPAASSGPALPVLDLTVFAAPSNSVWLPTIIHEAGLDRQHGFTLNVKQKPGQLAYAEFASGIDKVCFCAAPAAVARFVQKGADITLLWNAFNLEYVVVTRDPTIRKASDLAGHSLAADTGTGGWAIASLLLRQQGLDLSKVKVQSAWGAAQVAQLEAGRIDAVVISPVEATLLKGKGKDYTFFPVTDRSAWQAVTHSPGVPSIAMGVWRDWLREPGHEDLMRKLYAAMQDAVQLAHRDPERAAALISGKVEVMRDTILMTLRDYPQVIAVGPLEPYYESLALLTQKWLPEAGLLDRPLTDPELKSFVAQWSP